MRPWKERVARRTKKEKCQGKEGAEGARGKSTKYKREQSSTYMRYLNRHIHRGRKYNSGYKRLGGGAGGKLFLGYREQLRMIKSSGGGGR